MNARGVKYLFAINAQFSKETRMLRDGEPVEVWHTARLLTGN